MPQENYVLRCFSCEVFQVHIVKKAKKWECKMCGAKQSLKRNYGKGSGKDCRAQVMKLNELRMLKADIPGQMENDLFDEALTNNLEEQEPLGKKPSIRKWTEYLDKIESDTDEDAEDTEDINPFFENTVSKKKRKSYKENISNKKKFIIEDVSNVQNEESSQLNPALNHFEKFESNKQNERSNTNQSIIQSKNVGQTKPSKYSKYLDECESDGNNDLLTDSKISSNIFNSDSTDLDSILNF